MKEQIIFIESKPTTYTYRIARTLKLTGKYETVLVCFSEVDKDFFSKAFDKMHVLEWSHKPNLKNFIDFFRKRFGKKGRAFFNELKKMRPYSFQVTGTDLFTTIAMFSLKKSPIVYFTYDIWNSDKRKFLFTKSPGIKGCFQKIFERICFKRANGILHKGQPNELELLDCKPKVPDLSFLPGCLDEWICVPKKKKQSKEIELSYAGGPWPSHDGITPFSEVIEKFIPQKLSFHMFGDFADKKEKRLFFRKIKDKKYFYMHEKEKPDILNKKLFQYDYGIVPAFYDNSQSSSIIEPQMSTKLFNYIEAGIPIIMSKQLKFMAGIVEDNKIGFGVDCQDLGNLKEIIMKQDYGKMRENMKKAQEKFRLSKTIKELEEFYEKVVKEKRSQ